MARRIKVDKHSEWWLNFIRKCEINVMLQELTYFGGVYIPPVVCEITGACYVEAHVEFETEEQAMAFILRWS